MVSCGEKVMTIINQEIFCLNLRTYPEWRLLGHSMWPQNSGTFGHVEMAYGLFSPFLTKIHSLTPDDGTWNKECIWKFFLDWFSKCQDILNLQVAKPCVGMHIRSYNKKTDWLIRIYNVTNRHPDGYKGAVICHWTEYWKEQCSTEIFRPFNWNRYIESAIECSIH